MSENRATLDADELVHTESLVGRLETLVRYWPKASSAYAQLIRLIASGEITEVDLV